MPTETEHEITLLLEAWRSGHRSALDELFPKAYHRLRHLAEALFRREPSGDTLQPTAIVNELYIMLSRQRNVTLEDRTAFYSFAVYLIRLMLRTRARDRHAQKRGAGQRPVPLSDDMQWIDVSGPDLLDLEQALDELALQQARKVRLLELTAFIGLSTTEAADLLGISKATADRDLRFTKAWLYDRLKGTRSG